MGSKKLSAIWHIIFTRATLEGKMHLLMFMQDFVKYLTDDLEDYAVKKGQLHTLQALRAIVIEKMNQNGRQ